MATMDDAPTGLDGRGNPLDAPDDRKLTLEAQPEVAYVSPSHGRLRVLTLRAAATLAGGWVEKLPPWTVFERDDSVVALVYIRDTDEIVLTRQPRPATLLRGVTDFRVEPVARMIKPTENEAVIAQLVTNACAEEVGWRPEIVQPITRVFASPGGSSELMHIYFADVAEANRVRGFHPKDGVEPLRVRVADFREWLQRQVMSGQPIDAKLLICAEALELQLKKRARKEQRPLTRMALTHRPGMTLVLRQGDITEVDGVDLLVNSENVDFEMDQRTGPTVSGAIRRRSAYRKANGELMEERVWIDLMRERQRRARIEVGDVITTGAANLRRLGFRRILHVAVVPTDQGLIQSPGAAEIRRCVEHVLAEADAIACRPVAPQTLEARFGPRYRSIALPMIGAGRSGRPVPEAFPAILDGVIAAYDAGDTKRVAEIHFVAYRADDYDFALGELERRGAVRIDDR